MAKWHWIAARNMFYLKQVELDEAQYILGLQVRHLGHLGHLVPGGAMGCHDGIMIPQEQHQATGPLEELILNVIMSYYYESL